MILDRRCQGTVTPKATRLISSTHWLQRKLLNSFVQYIQAILTDGTGRLQTSESSLIFTSQLHPQFWRCGNWAFGFWLHAMCRVTPLEQQLTGSHLAQ